MDQLICMERKVVTTAHVPSTMSLSNQPLQQSPPAGNTFTSTHAAPHPTGKTNRAESEACTNGKNSIHKLLNEEEDTGVILKLPKIAGCTNNNALLVHLATPLNVGLI